MGKIQERMAAYDNISKVLELMRKKKAPVKSQRKLDKKPKKLDVEKFLPKDRPKTVLDEKINSRRIKQALEAEYQRVQGKTNTKVAEALKQLVTKSTETNIQEKLASEIAKAKTVMLVSIKNLPSSQLQKMKKDLRKHVKKRDY